MGNLKVTFFDQDGQSYQLEAEAEQSLMQVAIDNLVPGIYGDCGGFCTCATCHCYIGEQWLDKLPAATEEELAMIEGSAYLRPNSRLTCQIRMCEELDGIILEIPEDQY